MKIISDITEAQSGWAVFLGHLNQYIAMRKRNKSYSQKAYNGNLFP